MGELPSLDVVIVNWNAGPLLQACLASLAACDRDGWDLRRVVVVDNASSDGSAAALHAPSLPLVVVRNDRNRGFAAACNQGARGSAARYILFLNPDTVLQRDSLGVPIRFLEEPSSADVGVCGIQLLNQDGSVARSCSRFPTAPMLWAKMVGLEALLPARIARQPMSDWDHRTSRDVDQVIGAFFLVRRALFERLGGFDERFFVYFEEVDFSLRAAHEGYRSHFLASARATHTGGGSSNRVKAARLTYLLRSRLEYARKHFSPIGAGAVAAGTYLVEPVARVARAALRGRWSECAETVAGCAPLWRDAPRYAARLARRG